MDIFSLTPTDLWAPVWSALASHFAGNKKHIGIFCLWGVEFLCYYLFGLFFQIFEGCLEPFRIEKGKDPTPEKMYGAWKEATKNMFLHAVIWFLLWDAVFSKHVIVDSNPPGWSEFLTYFYGSAISNDFFFYCFHRLFHEFPSLYKLHKIHHEFNFTKGIVAEYAHPIEGLVCNILPTLSGTMFWCCYYGNVHLSFFISFLGFRLIETTELHSGFMFPISSAYLLPWHFIDYGWSHGISQSHYFHHSHNSGNYGSPLMDWLFGSDKVYRKFIDEELRKRAKAKAS